MLRGALTDKYAYAMPQQSGFVGARDKWNTYLNLQKMYQHHIRQGADLV